jgi:hypothetical protein
VGTHTGGCLRFKRQYHCTNYANVCNVGSIIMMMWASQMVRVCCLGTLTRMRLVGGFLPQAKACWIRVVSKQHIHIVIDIDSTVQQRSAAQ